MKKKLALAAVLVLCLSLTACSIEPAQTQVVAVVMALGLTLAACSTSAVEPTQAPTEAPAATEAPAVLATEPQVDMESLYRSTYLTVATDEVFLSDATEETRAAEELSRLEKLTAENGVTCDEAVAQGYQDWRAENYPESTCEFEWMATTKYYKSMVDHAFTAPNMLSETAATEKIIRHPEISNGGFWVRYKVDGENYHYAVAGLLSEIAFELPAEDGVSFDEVVEIRYVSQTANLRSSWSANSENKGQLTKGEEVILLAVGNGNALNWSLIRTPGGEVAFIWSSYLSVEKNQAHNGSGGSYSDSGSSNNSSGSSSGGGSSGSSGGNSSGSGNQNGTPGNTDPFAGWLNPPPEGSTVPPDEGLNEPPTEMGPGIGQEITGYIDPGPPPPGGVTDF